MSVKATLKRELGLRDLTLFAITCITSARWIPIAAHAGPVPSRLVFGSGVVVMVPSPWPWRRSWRNTPGRRVISLDPARVRSLARLHYCFLGLLDGDSVLVPDCRPLYIKVGFSMFGPSLARLGDNRLYLLAATVALIWIALGSNLIGLKVGKWTENVGALATWALGVLLGRGGHGWCGCVAVRPRPSSFFRNGVGGTINFWGRDRLCDFRHGRPWHDGWGDP